MDAFFRGCYCLISRWAFLHLNWKTGGAGFDIRRACRPSRSEFSVVFSETRVQLIPTTNQPRVLFSGRFSAPPDNSSYSYNPTPMHKIKSNGNLSGRQSARSVSKTVKDELVDWLVVGLSPIVTQGTWDYRWNVLRGVFLMDLNSYLREFRRKPQKTPNA